MKNTENNEKRNAKRAEEKKIREYLFEKSRNITKIQPCKNERKHTENMIYFENLQKRTAKGLKINSKRQLSHKTT